MRVSTDNLLQTSMGYDSLTLLVKLSHIHKDRKSERQDTNCIRKVDSYPFQYFLLSKALSAAEAMTVGMICF